MVIENEAVAAVSIPFDLPNDISLTVLGCPGLAGAAYVCALSQPENLSTTDRWAGTLAASWARTP